MARQSTSWATNIPLRNLQGLSPQSSRPTTSNQGTIPTTSPPTQSDVSDNITPRPLHLNHIYHLTPATTHYYIGQQFNFLYFQRHSPPTSRRSGCRAQLSNSLISRIVLLLNILYLLIQFNLPLFYLPCVIATLRAAGTDCHVRPGQLDMTSGLRGPEFARMWQKHMDKLRWIWTGMVVLGFVQIGVDAAWLAFRFVREEPTVIGTTVTIISIMLALAASILHAVGYHVYLSRLRDRHEELTWSKAMLQWSGECDDQWRWWGIHSIISVPMTFYVWSLVLFLIAVVIHFISKSSIYLAANLCAAVVSMLALTSLSSSLGYSLYLMVLWSHRICGVVL